MFLSTDDLARDVTRYKAAGVTFIREPREESYGAVAVFEDLLREPLGSPAAALIGANAETHAEPAAALMPDFVAGAPTPPR